MTLEEATHRFPQAMEALRVEFEDNDLSGLTFCTKDPDPRLHVTGNGVLAMVFEPTRGWLYYTRLP